MYGYQSPDATGMWVAKGSMAAARSGACTASLPEGRVLIIDGQSLIGTMNTVGISTADGSFSAAARMAGARSGHSCATLEDGQVLVAAGSNESGAVSTAEVFDPAINRWAPAGNWATLESSRSYRFATRIARRLIATLRIGNTPASIAIAFDRKSPGNAELKFQRIRFSVWSKRYGHAVTYSIQTTFDMYSVWITNCLNGNATEEATYKELRLRST